MTGGATGIGAAAVRVLTEAGARVVATRHTTAPPDVPGVYWLQCDVRDADAVEETVRAAAEEMGGLDVLLNAAGLWQPGIPGQITTDDIETLFDTNVKATILTNQLAYAVMRADGGGRIINFGSAEAVMGSPLSAVLRGDEGGGGRVDSLGGQGLGRREGVGDRAGARGTHAGCRPAARIPRSRRGVHGRTAQDIDSARRSTR